MSPKGEFKRPHMSPKGEFKSVDVVKSDHNSFNANWLLFILAVFDIKKHSW